MDALTRGVLLNVNILRFVQHFTKCCSLLLNDEVMQYQMKSKSLSLYCIKSDLRCWPLCQSTSICNARIRVRDILRYQQSKET